jgi:hypothetical protein
MAWTLSVTLRTEEVFKVAEWAVVVAISDSFFMAVARLPREAWQLAIDWWKLDRRSNNPRWKAALLSLRAMTSASSSALRARLPFAGELRFLFGKEGAQAGIFRF